MMSLEEYIRAVVDRYVLLPDIPEYARRADCRVARQLHAEGISLELVESAFLPATARRVCRSPTAPRLEPIRSLRSFLPVIEEIKQHPFPATYSDYLRSKLESVDSDDEIFPFDLSRQPREE